MNSRRKLPEPEYFAQVEVGEYPHEEIIPLLETAGCTFSNETRAVLASSVFANTMGMGLEELVTLDICEILTKYEKIETYTQLCNFITERLGLRLCHSDVAVALLLSMNPKLEKSGVYIAMQPIVVDGDPRILSVGSAPSLDIGTGDTFIRPWIEAERCDRLEYLTSGTMNMLFVR